MSLIRCEKGNIHNPACVFLHGFLGAKEDCQEMWEYLTERYYCIAFDLPGHGSSSALSTDYLKILEDEITCSATSPCILVGYSLGGRIALQLAEANPALYSHVIVLSAHPGLKEEKEKEQRLKSDAEWIAKIQGHGMPAFLKAWYDQPLFRSLHKRPDLLQNIIQSRSSQDPARMADVLWTLSPARQKAISSFHPRSLFLYGEEDEKFEKLSQMLPESVSVRKIERSGHVVHRENPKGCVEHILQWMEEP